MPIGEARNHGNIVMISNLNKNSNVSNKSETGIYLGTRGVNPFKEPTIWEKFKSWFSGSSSVSRQPLLQAESPSHLERASANQQQTALTSLRASGKATSSVKSLPNEKVAQKHLKEILKQHFTALHSDFNETTLKNLSAHFDDPQKWVHDNETTESQALFESKVRLSKEDIDQLAKELQKKALTKIIQFQFQCLKSDPKLAAKAKNKVIEIIKQPSDTFKNLMAPGAYANDKEHYEAYLYEILRHCIEAASNELKRPSGPYPLNKVSQSAALDYLLDLAAEGRKNTEIVELSKIATQKLTDFVLDSSKDKNSNKELKSTALECLTYLASSKLNKEPSKSSWTGASLFEGIGIPALKKNAKQAAAERKLQDAAFNGLSQIGSNETIDFEDSKVAISFVRDLATKENNDTTFKLAMESLAQIAIKNKGSSRSDLAKEELTNLSQLKEPPSTTKNSSVYYATWSANLDITSNKREYATQCLNSVQERSSGGSAENS